MQEVSFNIIVPPSPPCAECEELTTGYRAVDENTVLQPDKSGYAVMQVEAECPNGHVNTYTWKERWVWRWDDKCALSSSCKNRAAKGSDYCKACNEALDELRAGNKLK